MNLTAVRDPDSIVARHIGESLFAAAHLFPAGQSPIVGATPLSVPPLDRQGGEFVAHPDLIDLGSGAGFPGIPIKLWVPQLNVTLIESRQRKATFLREVIRTLQLTGISVFCGRGEDYRGPLANVVTLRAVEHFDEILPTAARLLRSTQRLEEHTKLCGSVSVSPRGELSEGRGFSRAEQMSAESAASAAEDPRLALLIGAAQISRANALLPTFAWSEPVPIPQSSSRVLLVGIKHG